MAGAAGRKKLVGRYEVGRTIGQGTFAEVKFAVDSDTGAAVAMKVLDKETILSHRMLQQARHGKLRENEARKYFQQLIDAIDYCHSKGVYHRDLKPENLLLDACGNLKVSDFGLSTLSQNESLVLGSNGYDGSAADIWSCGVILYVLMAGYLPFEENDLPRLYEKRITIEQIRAHPWFKKNYVAITRGEDENVSLDDVQAVFNNIEDKYVSEEVTPKDGGPLMMNAFEMITLSQGLDLSALFDRQQDFVKRQTRFVSRKPAKMIVATIEAVAESVGLKVHSQNYKIRLEGMSSNRMGQFAVVLEVFEVAPSLFMVDVRKVAGDTLEYHRVILQELVQQTRQHNLEASRSFCEILAAEDDHAKPRH
nr:unnamed protein product [Digitaria exilis]